MSLRRLAAASLAYVVVPLVLLGPAVDPARSLAGGDWTDLLYPFFDFTREVFQEEGRFPFWNPRIFSGQPHLASLNVLAFYPSELAAILLGWDAAAFYALDLIAHLWLAGVAMFVFLACSGRSAAAAFTGGICYALGSHLLTLAAAGHPHWVRCMAWLPLIMTALDLGFRGGKLRWYAVAGGMLGLCVLTAAMQFVACALLVLLVWIPLGVPGCEFGVPRSVSERGTRITGLRRRPALFAGAALLVTVAGMAGLGAAVWAPGLEYYFHSVRADPSRGWPGTWALSPWEFVSFLLPEFWGVADGYFGPHPFRPSSDYPGLLPMALAGLGCAAGARARGRWIILAVASVLLALGPAFSVTGWLTGLPVYAGFRTSLRWLSFAHLAGCVLVAHGWDALAARRGRAAGVAAGILLALALAWTGLRAAAGWLSEAVARLPFVAAHVAGGMAAPADVEAAVSFSLGKGAVLALVSGAALVFAGWGRTGPRVRAGAIWGVMLVDLLVSSGPFFLFAPVAGRRPPGPVTGFLASRGDAPFRVASDEYAGIHNRRMGDGLESISGYHGLPLERYRRFLAALSGTPGLAGLAALNARYLVTAGTAPPGWRTVAVLDGEAGPDRVRVLRRAGAAPRAFLAREAVECPGLDAALAEIGRHGWSPGRVPVDSPLPRDLAGARLASRGGIAFRRAGDRISGTVDVAGPALLVFSEVWYPAWRAQLDGARIGMLRPWGTLRAIAVPRGSHSFEMIYSSCWARIGIMVSWLTAVLAGVAGAALLRRSGW